MAKGANRFKTAVEATPDVKNCYQAGLDALLHGHKAKIELADDLKCNGSVDIDACTAEKYIGANRWDYCFGYDDKVYFVEVHKATTGAVSTVLKKLQWLKGWLISDAPELNKIKGSPPYHWIQSGKYAISKNSLQAKAITSAGINLRPKPKLTL